MSNSVDNRVVSMEFDNAKFERNVAQSLETLKHLDKSLDGLSNSSKKFDGVSFEDVANSIESLASRFTLSGRIIQKVFDDIAQGIVNVGHKLINFSLEGVTSGWDKYAEKTTSVQTIMNATGESIEYVGEQLERLNRFTDETSYNFTDMTSNIAKFTSQGIGLETAVTQMQGIATWAASAGQNAQAASRAMYNISQAMGAGSMKLIDWKSIQNANMATKEFKEQAIAAGLAVESIIEKEGKFVTKNGEVEVSVKNFEQTLQKGWFNTEAMQKVFTEYGKFAVVVDEVSENADITVTELLKLAEAQEKGALLTKEGTVDYEALENALGDTDMTAEQLYQELQRLNSEELKFSKATYRAAQEAKTFADAVDATRDAVSTAWMNVYETIFGNYEESRHLWTDMANWWYDIFAEPVNAIQETLSTVMGGSRQTKKASNIISRSIGEILDSTGVKADQADGILTTVLKKSGLLTDDMIKEAGSVESAISGLTGSTGNLKNVIDQMLDSNTAGAKTAAQSLEEYKTVASEIWNGKWGSGTERKNLLEEAGFDYRTAQYFSELRREGIAPTEAALWRLSETASNLTDEQRDALLKIQKAIETGDGSLEELMDTMDVFEDKYADWTGRELLFGRGDGSSNDPENRRGAIYDIMDIINSIGDAINNAWSGIFNVDKVGVIRTFLENFKKFTQSIKDSIGDGKQLERTFSGVFAVFDIGRMGLSALFNGFKEVIGLFLPTKIGLGGMAASLGDWLVQIRNTIKDHKIFETSIGKIVDVFKTLRVSLQPAIDKVKELWGNFKKNDGVKETTSFFSNVFTVAIKGATTVVSKLGEGFSKLTEGMSDFYNKYLAQYVSKFVNFVSQLANGTKSIADVFRQVKSAVVDFFTILFNFIKNRDFDQFVTDLTTRFSGASAAVQAFGNKLLNGLGWLFNIDKDTALAVAKLSVALIGLVGVLKIFKRLTSISASISNFFNTLSSGIKAFVMNYKVNTVLKIAAAIVVLVGAMYAITKIPVEDLGRAKTTLFEIMGLFALITALVSAGMIWGNPATSAAFAAAILAMAAAIAAAVGALWVLTTKVDYSKLGEAYKALFNVMAMMVLAMIALTRYAGKATISAMGMLAFAGSVLLMVAVLQKIQSSGTTITADAFAKLFGILAALAIMSLALKGVKLSSALGLLLFVASLRLMTKMLEKFVEEIPPADKILNKLEDLMVIFGLLLSLAIISRIAGGGGLKMAVSLVAVIGAIYVLAKVAADIGELPASQLAKGTAVVIALGLMVGAVIWLMQTSALIGGPKKGFAASVIAVVAGIIALGIELLVLSAIPWNNLLRGMAAVAAVAGALSLVFLALGKLSGSMKFMDFLGLVATFLLLGEVFKALNDLSQHADGALEAAGALGITMVALAGALTILSKCDFNHQSLIGMGKTFLAAIGILIPVFAALFVLNRMKLNTDDIITKVLAVSILMEALAVALALMSLASGPATDSLVNAGALILASLSMMILMGVLQGLNDVNAEGLVPKVQSLALLFGVLAGAVLILSLMPGPGAALTALAGIADICAAIILFSATFALVGAACEEWPGLGEKITVGAEVVGEAIGKFVGGLVGGLISGAIEALADLKTFADDLEEVSTSLKGFDDSAIAGAKAMAGLLLALGAAELVDSINNVLGGWLTKLTGHDLGDQLKKFAQGVVAYVEETKSLNANDINKVAQITNAMSGLLNAIPKEGGLFDLFTGSKSQGMANLKENLGGENGFGAAIKTFVESVRGVQSSDLTTIKRVKTIVEDLGSMMESIGKSGGLVQDVMGESNIAMFGTQMLAFVRSLVGGTIPGTSGESEGILTLAEQLPEETPGLDRLKTITDALSGAIGSIQPLGGLIDKIFGSDDPTVFGEEMSTFIDQIIDIGTKASGITADTVTAIQNAASAAQALYIFNAATNGQLVAPDTENAEAAVEVTEKMTEAVDTVKEMDVESAKPKVNEFYNMLNPGEGFSLDTISASIETAVDGIGNIFASKQGVVVTAIGGFMDGMTTSIATKQPELEATMTAMTTSVTSNLDTLTQDAETAYQTSGSNIAIAFANGLNSSEAISTIQETAKNLINSAIQTMETTAKIEDGSTSTEAKEVGKIFGNSFVKGLDEKKDKIKEKAVDMVKSLIQGFTERQADAGAAGQEMVDSFLTPFTTAIDALSEQSGLKVEEIYAILNQGVIDAGTAGTDTATSYATHVESGKQGAKEAADSVAKEATQVLEDSKSDAEVAGGNFTLGFAAGISLYIADVTAAAIEVAQAALDAISTTIDEGSPSKETKKSGRFFGQGFAIGIRETAGLVRNEANAMAGSATSAISEAARLASEIVESDANPVITPILDMSEVRSGMSGMSNLGSFAATVSASKANMAYDSAQIREIQNGTSGPITAVLSESAARALAGSRQSSNKTVIEFTGDLAQLARVLHPVIVDQYNYHGDSLIK